MGRKAQRRPAKAKPEKREPGLYLRGEVWWARFSVAGKQYRQSLETEKQTEARSRLAKLRTEIAEGKWWPEKRKTELTIDKLRDAWLKHAKDKASLSDDEVRFERIVTFFGEERTIATIETSDVDELKEALAEEPTRDGTMKPATINRHLALLRSALKLAEREGHFTRRPVIRMLAEKNSRADRVASDVEMARLLEASTGELKLAIVVARWSAMRAGEIAGLEWSRLDLKRGLVRLGDEHTKSGEGRVVPLGKPAIEALAAAPRRLKDPLVFTLKRETISSAFSKLCREIGIENLHLHDLRGTRLSELRRAGVDLPTLQRISGHKTLGILVSRYQAVSEDELIEAARKAERTP